MLPRLRNKGEVFMRSRGVKQFNKINIILLLLSFVVVFLLCLYLKTFGVCIVIFGIIYFVYKKITLKLRYKYIDSILCEDLNAKRYYDEIINKSKFPVSTLKYVVANLFVGNHKHIERVLADELRSAKGKYRNAYNNCLKFVYFETNKIEELKAIINDEHNNEGKTDRFFIHYISNDFNQCLLDCDQIEQTLKIAKNKNKYFHLESVRLNFMRAVVYCKMGEINKSILLFDKIIQQTPNMHYADISSNYIKMMETGDELYISSEALFVDRYAVNNYVLNKKRRIIWNVLYWIIVAAMITLAALGMALNFSSNNNISESKAQKIYNQEINRYLDDSFTDYAVIEEFYFDVEDVFIVKSEGKYSIVGYVFEIIDNRKPLTKFQVYADNIEFNKRYESYLCSNGASVSFMITELYYRISPEAFFIEEIELDGDKYYFAISNVRSYQDRYDEALDKTMRDKFGDYTILSCYYSAAPNIYLIESDGKFSIVGFSFEIDGWDKATYNWSMYEDDVAFETIYYVESTNNIKQLSLLITRSSTNIPKDTLFVEKIVANGNEYFFCIGN